MYQVVLMFPFKKALFSISFIFSCVYICDKSFEAVDNNVKKEEDDLSYKRERKFRAPFIV